MSAWGLLRDVRSRVNCAKSAASLAGPRHPPSGHARVESLRKGAVMRPQDHGWSGRHPHRHTDRETAHGIDTLISAEPFPIQAPRGLGTTLANRARRQQAAGALPSHRGGEWLAVACGVRGSAPLGELAMV